MQADDIIFDGETECWEHLQYFLISSLLRTSTKDRNHLCTVNENFHVWHQNNSRYHESQVLKLVKICHPTQRPWRN